MGTVHFKTIVLIFLLMYMVSVATHDNGSYYLLKYLKSLNNIVRFAEKNEDFVSVNLGFGLFLAKVNLKASLRRSDAFTGPVASIILKIIHEIDGPLNHFRERVSDKNGGYDERIRKIVSLLNESSWTERIRSYENVKLWRTSESSGTLKYVYRESLTRNVDEQHELPSPRQSDICLASISENPMSTERPMTRCNIYRACYEIILNGTNYGFPFMHRLLFILAGHFGRNCYVFSRHQDEVLIQEMCAWALKEAQYIAEHGYKLRDLMMEQIALCSLNGHGEFIQPKWTSKFLELQSREKGCFGVYNSSRCHEHVTGVAAAATAAAIRFLVQGIYQEM